MCGGEAREKWGKVAEFLSALHSFVVAEGWLNSGISCRVCPHRHAREDSRISSGVKLSGCRRNDNSNSILAKVAIESGSTTPGHEADGPISEMG